MAKLSGINKIEETIEQGNNELKNFSMKKKISTFLLVGLIGVRGLSPISANAGLLTDLKSFGNSVVDYTVETGKEISKTDTYKKTSKEMKKRGNDIKNSEGGQLVIERGSKTWGFLKDMGNKVVEYDKKYKREQERKKEYSQSNESSMEY